MKVIQFAPHHLAILERGRPYTWGNTTVKLGGDSESWVKGTVHWISQKDWQHILQGGELRLGKVKFSLDPTQEGMPRESKTTSHFLPVPESPSANQGLVGE